MFCSSVPLNADAYTERQYRQQILFLRHGMAKASDALDNSGTPLTARELCAKLTLRELVLRRGIGQRDIDRFVEACRAFEDRNGVTYADNKQTRLDALVTSKLDSFYLLHVMRPDGNWRTTRHEIETAVKLYSFSPLDVLTTHLPGPTTDLFIKPAIVVTLLILATLKLPLRINTALLVPGGQKQEEKKSDHGHLIAGGIAGAVILTALLFKVHPALMASAGKILAGTGASLLTMVKKIRNPLQLFQVPASKHQPHQNVLIAWFQHKLLPSTGEGLRKAGKTVGTLGLGFAQMYLFNTAIDFVFHSASSLVNRQHDTNRKETSPIC